MIFLYNAKTADSKQFVYAEIVVILLSPSPHTLFRDYKSKLFSLSKKSKRSRLKNGMYTEFLATLPLPDFVIAYPKTL